MGHFRRKRELRKLRAERRAEGADIDEQVRRARTAKKSAEEISKIYSDGQSVLNYCDDRIATAEAAYLIDLAQAYHVAIPDFSVVSPSWERAQQSQAYRLSQAGRTNLLSAIRVEKRAKWEERGRLLPFISAITGLLGVVVAILALLGRHG